uniref:Uncharacterized protein n=1 Tax=Anguilla anguilla TaxID=7936 RepID=A0A0E9PJE5_ANGAN
MMPDYYYYFVFYLLFSAFIQFCMLPRHLHRRDINLNKELVK